jgi:hypothetical protein
MILCFTRGITSAASAAAFTSASLALLEGVVRRKDVAKCTGAGLGFQRGQRVGVRERNGVGHRTRPEKQGKET